MMIPHKYTYKKSHPENDPNTTTTTIRYIGTPKDSQQLYCHSPASTSPKHEFKNDVKAFVRSGHAEEYDGLCWCEWTNRHYTALCIHLSIHAHIYICCCSCHPQHRRSRCGRRTSYTTTHKNFNHETSYTFLTHTARESIPQRGTNSILKINRKNCIESRLLPQSGFRCKSFYGWIIQA